MIKGDYPYPADEFDAVDPSQGPRGVHRRARGRWAAVAPYGVALVVSAGLALVLIGLLWDERAALPAGLPDLGLAPTAAPAPTGAVAAPTPSADPTELPVDLDTPVQVLNSTSVAGLAADAAERLVAAGWTDVRSGNSTDGSRATSVVRYAAPDLEGSAREVAVVLGIDAVEPVDASADDGTGDDGAAGGTGDDAPGGIEVVLGDDVTG